MSISVKEFDGGRPRRRLARSAWLVVVLVAATACSPSTHRSSRDRPPAHPGDQSARRLLGGLPLEFTPNVGQTDPRVAFTVTGATTAAYFTDRGITIAFSKPPPRARSRSSVPRTASLGAPAGARWAVGIDFVGARVVRPVGRHRTPTRVSDFSGSRSSWHTGIPTYSEIVYRNLWPGIDLASTGAPHGLEYRFVVHPGADPSRIGLRYRGATGLRTDAAGNLHVSTGLGSFTDLAPRSFQAVRATRVGVDSVFAARASDTYGFRVGTYDRSRTLVIDPAVVGFAGYIGGQSGDGALALATDSSGNAYVTGLAQSDVTFPSVVGPDLTANGDWDAFVAKVVVPRHFPFTPVLAYAGFIGGVGYDDGEGIAVDGAGNAYVAGRTESDQASFPVTGGPDLTANGDSDAFVAKVDATGASLDYAGYIGGDGVDGATGVAVNSSGDAYVSGFTSSSQSTFPVTVGPDLTIGGGEDAFVAKVHVITHFPFKPVLAFAGYIGGVQEDAAWGIATDSVGNAYVTGVTSSDQSSFPVSVGPDLTYNGGDHDAFVAKVTTGGTGFVYAGYVGGDGVDFGHGVAVDRSGNADVVGFTTSDQFTFPAIVGPDLTYNGNQQNGEEDAFVAQVDATGTGLNYAGYIGGSGFDDALAVAVDPSGNAFITGATTSGHNFPVVGGPDLTYNGGKGDAFVAGVSDDGSTLTFAGYLGGSSTDEGAGIAVDPAGDLLVAGLTSSDQSSFPVSVGPDLTYNGGGDAFVARIHLIADQPDALLKRSDEATYLGNDVYDLTGAGQTAQANQRRGSTVTFDVREQNDGKGAPDTFTIRGRAGGARFHVTYLAGLTGTTDVTTRVIDGTYALSNIDPGSAKAIRVVVHVAAGTPIYTIQDFPIVATSEREPSKQDVVVARVLVIPG